MNEITTSFSSKNDSNYFDNTTLENSSDWQWNEKQKTNNDKCWKGYSNYPYLWIITGPMTLVIFVRIYITLFYSYIVCIKYVNTYKEAIYTYIFHFS